MATNVDTKKKWRLDEEGYPYAICPRCHVHFSALAAILDRKQKIKYLCPYCEKVIANSEAEAEALYCDPANAAKNEA